MATRNTRKTSAIADSVDAAPAPADVIDTAPTAPADPAPADDTADTADTAPVLSYVIDGVTHTVDPERVESLAYAIGSGRAARHGRALTVGRFIADHVGMNPNRAHGILIRAGHYCHRDTVNGAANAYALTVEFMPSDADGDPGDILADVLSLVDAVGIRKIRGTHNNVSVIGYDTLSALTDPAARESEFRSAILAALSAARNVGMPTPADPADGPADGDPVDGDPVDGDPVDPDAGPVDIPALWSTALADIASAILTAGALTAAQRAALADGASAILSALADTADRTADDTADVLSAA